MRAGNPLLCHKDRYSLLGLGPEQVFLESTGYPFQRPTRKDNVGIAIGWVSNIEFSGVLTYSSQSQGTFRIGTVNYEAVTRLP
jgi:hypothetical protein